MNWKEYYETRRISAEAAAALVRAGMRVQFPLANKPIVQQALVARTEELADAIDLRLSAPGTDAGWLSRDLSAT
ncbi:MAG: hypothetical protein ACREQN_07755 [Candidatus Binataceae bacterium]